MPDLFGNEPIKALSWKEPYGTLMLHGKIETRTWNTSYRGLVLICLSKAAYVQTAMFQIAGHMQNKRIGDIMGLYGPDYNMRGMAIGIGRLVDSRPMTSADQDACFVQYHPGWVNHNGKFIKLYCHVYQDVRPIEPFPWKGSLGFTNVGQETIDRIKFKELPPLDITK